MTPPLLACEACDYKVTDLAAHPWSFRCPRAGSDEADHLLAPVPRSDPPRDDPASPHPFVRFRERLFLHRAALALGIGDAEYVRTVLRLDTAIAALDGTGIHETPLLRSTLLEQTPALLPGSEVWLKDETGNVAGSHKCRHLFGIAVYLSFLQTAGLAPRGPLRLAIASCGNAALAAAVVARAAGHHLQVFVPPDAHRRVLSRLQDLGARLQICERAPGELGDPCVRAFREAVARGAVPFACQGSENGITLDGGLTLGFEIAAALGRSRPPDRIFVQVGGGALASSLWRSLHQAVQMGNLPRAPRLMTVQSERVAPLAEAYQRTVAGIFSRCPSLLPPEGDPDLLADTFLLPEAAPALTATLADMAAHRARYLQIWKTPTHSLAHGILDDDTYDGAALLKGMLHTGGSPLLVPEPTLAEAEQICSTLGIQADPTGAAALAGFLHWRRSHEPTHERIVVLVTGHRR